MGNAGLCNRCKNGYRWSGGPPAKKCYRCKGTGVDSAPPAPHIISVAEWPAYLRAQRRAMR